MGSPIKAVIIEDEYRVRQVLVTLLTKFCPEIQIVGQAKNIKEGYALIHKERPDLIFLDVEMPRGNGFELLAEFNEPWFETIFVTSYMHYAVKAIKYGALDYLLKPIMIDDVKQIVERYKSKLAQKRFPSKDPLPKEKAKDQPQRLILNNKTKLDHVNLDDIIYLKANGNYTLIVTVDNKNHLIAKTLKEYEALFLKMEDNRFIRIHKSFIINFAYIHTIEKGEFVVLKDGSRIEISRRKRQDLMLRFNSQ